MTCGIYLGILLCVSNVCCALALHKDKSFMTHNTDSPVDHGQVQVTFEGSRPQDEFRQVYVDIRAKRGLYREQHSASPARHKPSVQQYLSSLAKSSWHSVDSSNGNVPQQVFGQSLSRAGSSVSDSGNSNDGALRALLGQQGMLHTGRYVPGKPDWHRSKAHQPSAWKPHSTGKVQQKPGLDTSAQWTGSNLNGGFDPPKEFVKSTSGLSRGRKVLLKGVSSKPSSSHYPLNPVVSNIHERYKFPNYQHFGLQQSHQVSGFHQNAHVGSLNGLSPAPGPMAGYELQHTGPFKVHHIPRPYGGYPIKRLGDDEPMEQTTTTKKPVTLKPTYTHPTHHTEPYRPRPPSVHQKSKWVKIWSNQLAGLSGGNLGTL